jgi:dTDP-L-rhamnose 4-epimerase
MEKILVTGGAGFIGSHTVDLLVDKGYKVTILDNFEPQVHKTHPDYVNQEAALVRGDITIPSTWEILKGMDAVIHLASMVGVGQSMYEPVRYLSANTVATALMYEYIMKNKLPIQKIIIPSSKATYGEGAYLCEEHSEVYPSLRPLSQLERKEWEQKCPECGKEVLPVPVKESKPQQNLSTYALSKYDQERLCINYGFTLKIPSIAMRYFNVYGPRQSLNNPYTGVTAIFSSRIKNSNPPVIYEDGKQIRDFIYVSDVAKANLLALEKGEGYKVYNVGYGQPTSISDIAETLIKLFSSEVRPEITNQFRFGDTRHDYGDISLIKKELGFTPEVGLEQGMKKLVEWGQQAEAEDKFDSALKELKDHGLVD